MKTKKENFELEKYIHELKESIREKMICIFNLPDKCIPDDIPGMIMAWKNYEYNLIAFILEKGLYNELSHYHRKINMLSPGGQSRAVGISFSECTNKGAESANKEISSRYLRNKNDSELLN